MSNFDEAFEKTMVNEGGFVLHKNEGDRGGWTYAGIAENFWPDWEGWSIVRRDEDDPRLTPLVKAFYKKHFWDKMKLTKVTDPEISYNIFDFGMNTGTRTAIKLAQIAVESTPDGLIGPKTIAALNKVNPELFELRYAVLKIKRYISISRTKNRQFFRGWVIRTIKVLEQ